MTMTNAPSGTIRAALRYPDFRYLLSALAVSQVGDWLYNLALVVLVYDRTPAAGWAGLTTAARVAPCACGSPTAPPRWWARAGLPLPGWCRAWFSARWAGCWPPGSTAAAS